MVLPLSSNIGPISDAVSKSLRDSLDIYRKTVDDITIQFTRLEDIGISPIQLLVGVLVTAFGFIFYYFIPMSVLYKKFNLFFFLIIFVLLLILMGLIFIGQIFFPMLKNALLHISMFVMA